MEKCLPQEYKRKYTKSEQGSLSRNDEKFEKIVVHNDGKCLSESSFNGSNIDNNIDTHKTQGRDRNQILEKESSNNLNDDIYIPCHGSEEALKPSAATSVEYLSPIEIKFTIPKEKYEDVKTAIDRSSNCCYLFFDAYTSMLLRSESD